MLFDKLKHSNTSKEDWQAIRASADDCTIVIKKADEGSCVVILDRMVYLLEAKKQLSNSSVYKSVNFKQQLLTDLIES